MAVDLPPQVETVEVRAARLPPALGDAAFSVTRIDPQVIETAGRLDTALASSPGVSLFRRVSSLGANPTTQGLSVRQIAGSGAGRALVTLDGVPMGDAFGGWVIWSSLPTEGITGVTVAKGAGAGAYGAGALTGVIALEERDAGAAAEISGGSEGYHRMALSASTPADNKMRFNFTGQREVSDGWIPVQESRRGAADTPLTLDDYSVSAKAEGDIGRAVAAVRVQAFRETRNAGLVNAASKAQGRQASVTIAAAPTETELGWRLQGWVKDSSLYNSSASVAANRATTTPASIQYSTPADGWGLNAALRRVRNGTSLELGADVRGTEGESKELATFTNGAFTRGRIAGGKTLVGGLYLEGSQETKDWLFAGGVRIDYSENTDAHRIERTLATGAITLNSSQPDQSKWLPTGRIGVKRAFSDALYFRTAAYAGFRPATLNELHRPFRVGNDVTEANPALKPERLYGAEAGFGGDGFISWSAIGFFNRLQDQIANVTLGVGAGTIASLPLAGFIPAGGTLRQRQNAGRVDAYGVEADAQHRWGRFSLHTAASYVHAKVDGGSVAPQLTGLRPAQTPRLAATLGAQYDLGPVSTRIDVRYESARFDDDQNLRRLAPGTTLDARIDYHLGGGAGVYVAAENLGDANIQTARTADGVVSLAPPRLFRVGFSFSR
jgi:outer membrane receptor protein involved in Fe transport